MKIYGGELIPSGSTTTLPVTALATTGSNIFNGTQTVNGNKVINGDLIVTGSLTAQQYIVSSSVTYLTQSFASGSNVFGNSGDDTQQFTGSVSISGSQSLVGNLTVAVAGSTEFQVQQAGVTMGNVVTDTHRVTGSLNVSGSIATTGTLDGNIISANSAGSTQIFLKSTGAGSNRQWQIQSNETAAGDLSFMQSTAAGGSTYATKFNLTPTGAATFGSSVTATNLYLGTLTNEQLMVSGTGSRGIGVSTITSGDPFVRLYDNTTIKADIWWGRSGNYMGINSLGSGSITAINPNGGNVLIGTTTDAGYKLDVNGYGRFSNQLLLGNFNGEALKFQSATSTGSTYLRFYNSAATSRGYFGLFWSGTADYMVLDSGALEMNFGSSNKFTFTGGGTATFSGALSGTSANFSSSVVANNTSIFSNGSALSAIFSNGGSAGNYNAIELRGGTAGTAVNWQISKDNSTANAFELAASTVAGGTTYGSPVFKITSSGAATFSSSVTLGGNIMLPGSISSSSQLNFKNVGSEFQLMNFPASNNTITLYGATDTIYFKTDKAISNQNILSLGTNGNVGIGTTTPNTSLVIANSNGNSVSTYSGNVDDIGMLQLYANGANANSSSVTVRNYYGTGQFMQWGTNGMRIGSRILVNAGSGNLYFTTGNDVVAMQLIGNNLTVTGTITENSSIRYKNDIETVKFGLDKVLQMRGVTYTKKDTGLKELGLIAEEVNEILPEAVLKNNEGEPDSVSYGRITAVLIEAIKEQQKQIEELKALIK
jgi:hypothetical protein